jgi:hypothetical protein
MQSNQHFTVKTLGVLLGFRQEKLNKIDLRVPANTTEYESSVRMRTNNLKRIFDLHCRNLKAIELPHYLASMSA